VQFLGVRVTVRVSGPAAVEGAVEVAAGHGLKLVADLDGEHAALGEGVGAAVDREHVGLGDVRLDEARAALVLVRLPAAQHLWAGEARLAEGPRDLVVLDEAVAVPEGLALLQPDAVDHAGADEPVVGPRVLRVERVRVGANPQEPAVEVLGDLAGDL
jgi:hypothetical protein